MKSINQYSLIIMGVLLSLGIAVGGYFVGQVLYNAKLDTAEVKGLAERRVEADRANWQIKYRQGYDFLENRQGYGIKGKQFLEIKGLYLAVENTQARIIGVLKENGFDDDEIKIGVIDYHTEEYRNKDQVLIETRYILSGQINVETNKVRLVPKVRGKLNKLLAESIAVTNSEPTYLFTKLNEIKPEMIKEATANARIAANEFAKVAKAKITGIKTAKQGNFYIRDVAEDYSDDRKIEKDVRVVATISFYLEN